MGAEETFERDTHDVDLLRATLRGQSERVGGRRIGHIIDPRTGISPSTVASVTVVAPTALAADALATAAFVLDPADGIELLERHGVEGLIVTPALERFETSGLRR